MFFFGDHLNCIEDSLRKTAENLKAGSAFASLCAALFLMKMFGKQGSINFAASINIAVSAGAIVLFFIQQNKYNLNASRAGNERVVHSFKPAISFPLAVVFGFLSGYIALSYEIVWIRVYSFAMAGSAPTFPLVLSMYLTGIALGASEARRFCQNIASENSPVHVRALSRFCDICHYIRVPPGPALGARISTFLSRAGAAADNTRSSLSWGDLSACKPHGNRA